MKSDKKKPVINIRFLYALCNDIAAMRRFYSNGLAMKETGYNNGTQFGWLVYNSDGFQLMFFYRGWGKVPIAKGWSWQPGDGMGTAPTMSFSIEYPEKDFRKLVTRLRAAKSPAMSRTPTWRQSSYWGWTVKDPMGNTIEVYTTPKKGKKRTKGQNAPVWK